MLKRNGKLGITLLVTALMTSILAACGGNSNNASSQEPAGSPSAGASVSASPSASPSKEPVEMVLATFNAWGESEGLKSAIAAYEESTGNTVRVDVYPDDQFINILKTKMSTNDAPDLFMANAGDGMIPFSFLEPLQGPWVDKTLDSVKLFTAKDGVAYEAYAFPLGYFGAIYNKKVFEKAGVKVPMMNYAELMDGLKKIQGTGVTPIFIPGKDSWTYQMLQAVGGVYSVTDEDAAKMAKNETKPSEMPGFMQFAERMNSLVPYTNKDHLSLLIADGYQGLLDGKYGMTVLGDWLYDDLAKLDAEKVKDLGFMPFTMDDSKISAVVNLSGRALGVPLNSKHKQEAKDLVNYLMEPDHFNLLVKPVQGAAPYKDYDTEKSVWQEEMDGYIAQTGMPVTLDVIRQRFPTFPLGTDAGKPFLDIFNGKDIKKAFDDWYTDYAQYNRTVQTPGW
ncbi:ABC transporter substrate-binding protein [Cohnella herbarum]|uniref:Carbohydrate ABC transporter substrate-binding protein n=1 Tax=Cohnella herbarum TaxID=2728023 RepID=A0A7Z2VMM6_9BACL|nr:ABC transporter substrate-binding protein [Cohnella herbarum]QJD85857.1 carbohydrate ABC transporter substrate-binding protein [Cohnella herbarum]